MSIEIMNAVWKHSKATGRARLVLLAIADHQGELGAWPSIETLATMVNSSTRSVKRDIQELVDLGELQVEIQNAPTKTQYKTNLYFVTISGVTNLTSGVTESTSGVTESAPGVTAQVIRGDTVGTQNLNITITETLKKPFTEETKKATRMSNESMLTLSMNDFVINNFPHLNALQEFERFKDYWVAQPGSKGVKLDWEATWRNWIRKVDSDKQRWQSPVIANEIERKRKSEIDKQRTAELIGEMRLAKSEPPPVCEHGESIIRCRKCLLGIN